MTKKLKTQINQLIIDLQQVKLWDTTPPSTEQLASREPFCVDTLKFEQWLQWVFIPKLEQLIDMSGFNGLPNQSNIHTMAEYAFKEYVQDTNKICETVKQIDKALNQFSPPSIH